MGNRLIGKNKLVFLQGLLDAIRPTHIKVQILNALLIFVMIKMHTITTTPFGHMAGDIGPGKNIFLNGTELPDLPPSEAMILTDPSRQEEIIKFQNLIHAKQKTDYVIINQKTFTIKVTKRRAVK